MPATAKALRPQPASALPPAYRPRAPTETVLYRIVSEHYRTFVREIERDRDAPLPRYVREAFEKFLACGVFERGFTRCHCDACGHDLLVAFSCKQRGLCPSCCARRMANEAAFIVDRILPSVPVRQWVLSIPFELRGLAALKPDVLTALGRIFVEEVSSRLRRVVERSGVETGAIDFPQRFGGSLNLNVHFHAVVLDGAFSRRDDDAVQFHEAPPPSRDDIEQIASRVRDRSLRWLRRHGYVDQTAAEDRSSERPTPTALEACAQLALAGGAFLKRPVRAIGGEDDVTGDKRRFSASADGFDVQCAVRIAADDDEGRERLVRYCCRPAFALERIEALPDGRISFQMKFPSRGATHRVMQPMEFMARIAAIFPPPRFPLVRYHGVFAPSSTWRKLVIPKPRRAPECAVTPTPMQTPPQPQPPMPPTQPPTDAGDAIRVAPESEELSPTVISVKHWGRLRDGELLATSPRIEWSKLLQRTFVLDVLVCPRCHSRMRVLAAITDRATACSILDHLGVRSNVPPVAPARDPAGQAAFGFDA